jgi:hypothetical protein
MIGTGLRLVFEEVVKRLKAMFSFVVTDVNNITEQR